MPLDVYLGIVAATNMKQRTRKQIEYYHADRLNYAVAGTPNRLEYDQGFFVKNGDGAADVKPIAHLYKIAGLPARRTPRRAGGDPPAPADHRHLFAGADAGGVLLRSAAAARSTFCLYALNHGVPAAEVAPRVGLTAEQVERVYRDIEASAARRATCTQGRSGRTDRRLEQAPVGHRGGHGSLVAAIHMERGHVLDAPEPEAAAERRQVVPEADARRQVLRGRLALPPPITT